MGDDATRRAQMRWATRDKRAAFPWPCRYCHRSFGTERGRIQHHRWCWKNPQARRYTVGGYDGQGKYECLFNEEGAPVGMVWRGKNAIHGAAIKREMTATLSALGVDR